MTEILSTYDIDRYLQQLNQLASDYFEDIFEDHGNTSHYYDIFLLKPSIDPMEDRLGRMACTTYENPIETAKKCAVTITSITRERLDNVLNRWLFISGDGVTRKSDADEKAGRFKSALQPLLVGARISLFDADYSGFYACLWDDVIIESPLGDVVLSLTLSD